MTKNKGGRPSLYKPEYCDMLAKHFAEGYSFESFAGRVDCAIATLYNWCDQHEEFLEAKKRNEGKSQLWWEGTLNRFAKTGEGNATAIIFGLKNRAPASWRDKVETEHSGKVESITKIELVPLEGPSSDTA